jgi:hypothetical protein
LVVKVLCLSTTSAGALLTVGIVFQINTRLFTASERIKRPPTTAIPIGWFICVCEVPDVPVVKFACPTTTPAGTLPTGSVFQINTRLLRASDTNSLPFAVTVPIGKLNLSAAVPGSVKI